jgi:hypothetical protein
VKRKKSRPLGWDSFGQLLLVALLMLTRLRVAVITMLSTLTRLLRLLAWLRIALTALLSALTWLLVLLTGCMGAALLAWLVVWVCHV